GLIVKSSARPHLRIRWRNAAHPAVRKALLSRSDVSDHRGAQGSTNLVTAEREADRAPSAVWASVIAAHRITSSAFLRRAGGMVIPRAWAALRLIANWNSVGCCTTRSAGLVPLRI